MNAKELLSNRSPQARQAIVEAVAKEIERRKRENPLLFIPAQLQPKQKQFFEMTETSNSKWLAMGGARGGSKSKTIRDLMIFRRLKYSGSVGVLFRRSLNDLQDNHITPLFQEYPNLRKYYNVQQKTIKIPMKKDLPDDDERQIYSFIYFRHEEIEDKLVETFQGKNYDDIFVDEATHNSERALIAMSQSCRTTRTDMKSRFVLTMNPGGRSHSLIKRLFIDKKYIQNENKDDYAYLQAYGWDNAYWSINSLVQDGLTIDDYHKWDDNTRFDYFVERSEYGKNLNTLNDNDRKAHLFGDWYVFAGQFFSMWSEKNIIRKAYNHKNSFPKAGAIDYGNNTVFECCERDYDGNITFFAEDVTKNMIPTDRAKSLGRCLIDNELWGLNIDCDTDMGFANENYKGGNKAPIEIYNDTLREMFALEGFVGKEPNLNLVSKKSIDNRTYRITTNEFFKDYLQREKMKFVESACPKAIETIPELVYSKNDTNGLDFDNKIGYPHAFDACKYAFMQLFIPVEVETELAWITDWKKRTISTKGEWKPGMG